METTDQKIIFCTKCGSKNNEGNLFCSNCGNELETGKNDLLTKVNTEKIDEIKNNNFNINLDVDKSDLQKFVLKNSEYYMSKFEEIKITGNKISWNWSAFFLTGYWMLYRKMYIETLIMVLATMLLGSIPVIGVLVPIGVYIGLGMYGNTLYLNHVNKKMLEISRFDSSMKDSLIVKKGGTNLALPLILLIIFVLVLLLLCILAFAILGITMTEMMYYY